METAQAYHERRSEAHREMALKANTGNHAQIHVKLAELHRLAAREQGYTVSERVQN